MRFTQFFIKNFKGIEEIIFDLEKSPDAKIYTLVGLNESGKTTILEAMNHFTPKDKGMNVLDIPGTLIKDLNSIIPISKRDNFNDTIEIVVTLKLDADDMAKIDKYAKENTQFKFVRKIEKLTFYRNYKYENSKFKELDRLWTGFYGVLKSDSGRSFIKIDGTTYGEDNEKLSAFCNTLIPNILYFPNFLFDFPPKIYLLFKATPTEKEKFYVELIQDILFSLNNNTNIKTHIIDRIKSNSEAEKKNLGRLIQLMGRKVTEIVFGAWNRIFRKNITGTKVVISYGLGEGNNPYLEFEIEAEDGIYQINERSLGFRWFFIFLLFTQFRPFRKDNPKNVLFLFDEPASNLHSLAQNQLLKSFENLISNGRVIYTTHSHHLINPHWLESTYVVKNEGLQLEEPENYNIKQTKISIQPYRDFVNQHPHNTAYFQPILDVLDYAPSNLELVPDCIFVEGKNDFYSLAYFQKVIFKEFSNLNIAPSTGSGNLDILISLYIGWAKDFLILLDSDREGEKQKERYKKEFGISVEKRIFTLADIDSTWTNIALERLFDDEDKVGFQQSVFKETTEFNKTHFNRAIQENLSNNKRFNFSEVTINNFRKTLMFLCGKSLRCNSNL